MQTLLYDVYLEQQPGALTFGNAHLHLTIDLPSGGWKSFTIGENLSLPETSSLAETAAIKVDGAWQLENQAVTFLHYETSLDDHARCAHLHLVYQMNPQFELTVTYTLYPGQWRLKRSIRCVHRSAAEVHFEGFRFRLPSLVIGQPEACLFDAPGPFPFYANFSGQAQPVLFFPETPLAQLQGLDTIFSSAPDWGFGFMSITNPGMGLCLAGWMDTAGQVNYHCGLRSDGRMVDFTFIDEHAVRLGENQAIDSGVQVLFLAPTLPEALATYRRMAEIRMPLAPQPPEWVKEMVILEAFPEYFPGGLKTLAARLPFYHSIGFNTLYLMPHWPGGYGILDLYQVQSHLGTPADLKELVRQAHDLGMHVLFDMVIHGFDQESPVVKEHPEIFNRNPDGSFALHPDWKSVTCDWANPDYQAYMVAVAEHHAREYDIDGYRVDAAAFKGPNWDPQLPYPAYRSGTAAPELLHKMLAAMRRIKPQAILLNEVFGPLFYTECDLVHDNMTMGPQMFLEKLEKGAVTAQTYKLHMANTRDLLPPGANRVYFARNHDTSWFYHFNGYTQRFLALDAVHILFGIPEVFAGDLRNPPHPDDNPAVYAYYQKLFALRREFPELTRGEILLRQAVSSNPQIFSGLRRLGKYLTLAAISLSDRPESTMISIALETPPSGEPQVFDALTRQKVAFVYQSGKIELRLEPCQVIVCQWEVF